jgi:bifunctional non-homologous end joining protein LigD
MSEIAQANDAQWQSNRPAESAGKKPRRFAKKRVEPAFVMPMQCKAVTKLPEDDSWSFEIKFDGYRCIAVKRSSEVTLFSRNEKVLNDRFPNVVEALQEIAGDFVLDGEIVALDEQGRPSFQLLQNSRSRAISAYFYAFDLLHRDGESFLKEKLEQRRKRLTELLPDAAGTVRISPLLHAPAGQVLEAVQKLGLEGVVGKRHDSLYEPGERSGAWIKHRTDRQQEFVVGGYVPGAHGFDALLVGVYEGKQLQYVAKVRNGFVGRSREEIFPLFKKLTSTVCPFQHLPEKKSSRWGESLTAEKMKECRWLKPKLVCEVAFLEWTDAAHLRHCTFVAMRDDKAAAEVVRET